MPMPRQYVRRQATFTPLPYGLLTTLGEEVITPADNHWQTGITYESLCVSARDGTAGTTFEECFSITGAGEPAGEPPEKVATGGLVQRGATPFTVYSAVDCSAPGFWDRTQEIVNRLLTQSEQWQVERALWTGIVAGQPVVYPHLAADSELTDGDGVILQTETTVVSGSGSAVNIVEGLGLLEAALADCIDGVGVIHAPRSLAPALMDAHLLVEDNGRYRTPNGNLVVLGAGYRGTGPNGTTTSNTVWMYATGNLLIYRSNAQVMPRVSTLDRSTNIVTAIAERTYVIGWDCCHFGVPIQLGSA